MYPNRSLVLVVAVLVILAGCAGGAGSESVDGSSSGAPDSADRTSSVDGDAADVAGPDDEDFEISDAETVLRDAGSFTVSWRYTGVDRNGVETDVAREFRADLNGGRSYTAISATTDGEADGSSEQFVADGTTYLRSGSGESVTYASYDGSDDVVGAATALSQARAYDSSDELTFRGTETFDGVAVDRYELSTADTALIRAGSAAAPSDLEITDFRYAVLVDADGIPRHESWSFSGRTDDGTVVSGEWEYSLTGLGSTVVDDPDWLAAAVAAST